MSDWRAKAACRGLTDLFYTVRGEGQGDAKEVCHTKCPVQQECLDEAMNWTDGWKWGERHGVWGGTSERERRRLRVSIRKSAVRTSNGCYNEVDIPTSDEDEVNPNGADAEA